MDGPGMAGDAVQGARTRRERLHECMQELESVIAAPSPGREEQWRQRLASALGALESVFEHHVAETEAASGFFAQVVEHAPRLHRAVERLRDDHTEIATSLRRLSVQVEEAAATAPTDLRDAALDLLGSLARHRQLGADLLYEAYQVDISVGD
jgi:hypothetical protein